MIALKQKRLVASDSHFLHGLHTMSTELPSFKELNLNRECLEPVIDEFLTEHSLSLRSRGMLPEKQIYRVIIGKVGMVDATLDVYFNKNGTSTLNYKVGKNQQVGFDLAQRLFETIHPDEFQQVNMSIRGVAQDQIEPIISEVPECSEGDYQVEITRNEERQAQWRISSKINKDQIVVTHHRNTRTLQIQGRPLSCYRRLIYLMSSLLDLAGLEYVLSRTEDGGKAEIVRPEIAMEFLRTKLPKSVERLPKVTSALLLSSLCVRLSAPKLPDYSMLVFPELRSLEGAVKSFLADRGIEVTRERTVGSFYELQDPARNTYVLKQDYHHLMPQREEQTLVHNAYSFFNKHRHGLFHMESLIDGSRVIGSLEEVNRLTNTIYSFLDDLH